jgi:LCP family protein required for cell wall assembly
MKLKNSLIFYTKSWEGMVLRKPVVILAVVGIVIVLTIGMYAFVRATLNHFHEAGIEAADIDGGYGNDIQQDDSDVDGISGGDNEGKDVSKHGSSGGDKTEYTDPYLKMIKESKRINILCLGIAKYSLADVMIVASLDPESNSLDLISIPRDTYFYRPGFETAPEKKINASFYGKTLAERAQSSMNSVRDLLRIPVHHFVKIEYKGVEEIIDALGGVEVNIPFDMDYDDPLDDLHIHFKKGKRTLNGEEAVKFLRFRQNNDNTHSDGDIGRIKRQQDLIKTAMNKALGLQLFKLIDIAKEYIKTSMTADDMLAYAMELSQMDMDNVKTYVLPGEARYLNGASYYIHDEQATKDLIMEIYK